MKVWLSWLVRVAVAILVLIAPASAMMLSGFEMNLFRFILVTLIWLLWLAVAAFAITFSTGQL